MKINLAMWDRWVRYIIGLLLTTWAIAGGPSWAYVGVYFIFSASWGYCLIYSYFRIKTISTNVANTKIDS